MHVSALPRCPQRPWIARKRAGLTATRASAETGEKRGRRRRDNERERTITDGARLERNCPSARLIRFDHLVGEREQLRRNFETEGTRAAFQALAPPASSRSCADFEASCGLTSMAAEAALGIRSRNSSNRLRHIAAVVNTVTPMRLPPGRLRLATRRSDCTSARGIWKPSEMKDKPPRRLVDRITFLHRCCASAMRQVASPSYSRKIA